VILEASEMSEEVKLGTSRKWARGKEDFKRVRLMSSGTCLGFRQAIESYAGSE
jgi:hypothetical protein